MTEPTVVDRLYKEFAALDGHLAQTQELSLQVTANEQSRKSLLLASASHFEQVVTKAVTDWVELLSTVNSHIVEFVRKKGIDRQYHTWFEWSCRDHRAFSGLLGPPLKGFLRQHFDPAAEAGTALRDFLEIGESRNRLVHQDFGTFTLEKTTNDIYTLYLSARHFPAFLTVALTAYTDQFKKAETC